MDRDRAKQKSVIPREFWYFSIGGGLTLLAYAIHRLDPVFILGQGAGLFVYARNLYFIHRRGSRTAEDESADRRGDIMPVTINWAQCHTRPVLMIPGPTELPPPVIQALNHPRPSSTTTCSTSASWSPPRWRSARSFRPGTR